MKKLLDRILPWRRTIAKWREQYEALEKEQAQLKIEAEAMRQMLKNLRETHRTQLKGQSVLLEFIHRTHRLSVPAAKGTIRAALQNGESK